MKKLQKKIIINTKLKVLTGLHIGDSSDSIEIGGVDNPVVRMKKNNTPYIPGSSLKGKIRSLLEQIEGAVEVGGGMKKELDNGKKVDYKYEDKPKKIQEIINLFGYANDNKPSKIIVRDSEMDKDCALEFSEIDTLDMPYTEVKYENTIDRIKGTAAHPRQMERVPTGAIFNVEFILNVWDDDKDGEELFNLLKKGVKALELDYLGGSGTRGYGKVKFLDFPENINNCKVIELANL
ncbi:MAG: type III-A CRISPR-associated RAMP protein Csm3 [Bacteroidales bacterium]|nr:type III-A CRISPR-associated RAMP protein Csm3 [Bacteroidales bacterium]